ncbi:hypothetical protein H6G80_28425 [Nostoc sp. FACHB-87]|uniref:hypothetical protein n=1 Tax=Nostocaceae TaxID=1162 RepID=UPI001683C5BE|nr:MULTISPECIES: hypothetical protein [Nostocaceae]MBD2457978.1 hypothetical protein [Nostoc sp. FACHB-87]MBD2479245.1 hypothetical protein [Anabaena sp. FACHB-83]
MALHYVLNPSLTRPQITKLIKEQFQLELTYKQFLTAKEKIKPIIERLKNDDNLCLQIAKDCCFFKISHRIHRIQQLERIVENSINNGHEAAAVAAIKLIKEEFNIAQEAPSVQLVIGTATPPPQQDDDLTPEDEDL